MTAFLRLAAPLAAAALGTMAMTADAAPARKRQGATSGASAKPAFVDFARKVTLNDGGHVLGNPEAETKIVEFMSYTCSHCYDFSRTGEGIIKLALVPNGNVSYEIRHLLRDPVDLTATLLTHCGEVSDFPANHEAIMSKHPEWMERARKTSQAQRTRWSFGTNAARWRAIASDLGFYDIMETRGYTRATLDRCLADGAKAQALAETSARDTETYQLQGTPSFVMNGKLLDGVYSWDALRPKLDGLN